MRNSKLVQVREILGAEPCESTVDAAKRVVNMLDEACEHIESGVYDVRIIRGVRRFVKEVKESLPKWLTQV